MTLVAVSASYGAAGSRIAPALAERLGVPFLDRAIPMKAAGALEVPVGEEAHAPGGWLERVLRGFVGAEAAVSGPVATDSESFDELRRASEEPVLRQARAGRGVILGRAAVVTLRDDPRVLRVRLDGPPERRIEQAVRVFGADREAAAEAVRKLDRTHDAYLKQFYGLDIHDPALYHLVLDSTVLPVQTCVDVLALAAKARRTGLEPVVVGSR